MKNAAEAKSKVKKNIKGQKAIVVPDLEVVDLDLIDQAKEVAEIKPVVLKREEIRPAVDAKKSGVSKEASEPSKESGKRKIRGRNVNTEIKSTGKFGLGHQKTSKAAILYVLEDIWEAIVRAKNWCLKNYRTSIPLGIGLVLVISVFSIIVRNAHIDSALRSQALGNTASEGKEESLMDHVLEENTYEYVNRFVTKYFAACADGDLENYLLMRTATDESDQIRMLAKADYIDRYEIVSSIVKPGPEDKSYLAFVYYEVFFSGNETPTPGCKYLYLCTGENGELYVNSDENENVKAYAQEVFAQEDVQDLFVKVKVTYNDIVDSDEELRVFLDDLAMNLKKDVSVAIDDAGLRLPEPEVTPMPEITPEPTQTQEPKKETVVTTVKVNVRKSSSTESAKLGTVPEGTRLTRLESLTNGWSRIEYQGQEAYIKSEYLLVTETPIGTVKTTAAVNIRASASETASKLGTVNTGTTLELLERLENGWTRILYNGMTAYVKSEFVE